MELQDDGGRIRQDIHARLSAVRELDGQHGFSQVAGLPRHHTQTFASKPSVSSANSCLGQGGNADVRITRLFETVWADVKFAERGLRKKSRIPRRSTCQRAAQQRSIRWSRSLRNNLWVACGYRLD
jgi:hypothetical protein